MYRKSENRKFKVTVVRNLILVKSIDVATKINNKTGYIKVNRFAETTYNEFLNALVSLKKQGSKKVALGTDYPFPLGDLKIGQFIEEMELDTATIEDIFYQSALDWLQMSKNEFV